MRNKKLAAAIAAAGDKPTLLARRLRLARGTIEGMIAGDRRPTMAVIDIVAKGLGLSRADIGYAEDSRDRVE